MTESEAMTLLRIDKKQLEVAVRELMAKFMKEHPDVSLSVEGVTCRKERSDGTYFTQWPRVNVSIGF